MAELAAAYLTAGVPQELCGLFLLAAAGLVSAVKYRKEDGWRKHSIRGLWAGF